MKASFRSAKENEISIKKDDVVIVRTLNIQGWCYAQSLEGEKGYVPFSYLISFFPTTEYFPEWQQLVSLRSNPIPKRRVNSSVRKDLLIAQRRSRVSAQNSSPFTLEFVFLLLHHLLERYRLLASPSRQATVIKRKQPEVKVGTVRINAIMYRNRVIKEDLCVLFRIHSSPSSLSQSLRNCMFKKHSVLFMCSGYLRECIIQSTERIDSTNSAKTASLTTNLEVFWRICIFQ